MVAADGPAPIWRRGICNNHADLQWMLLTQIQAYQRCSFVRDLSEFAWSISGFLELIRPQALHYRKCVNTSCLKHIQVSANHGYADPNLYMTHCKLLSVTTVCTYIHQTQKTSLTFPCVFRVWRGSVTSPSPMLYSTKCHAVCAVRRGHQPSPQFLSDRPAAPLLSCVLPFILSVSASICQ